MYYPLGLPKQLKRLKCSREIISVVCNRDRILFAILFDRGIAIWFSKPCVLIYYHERSDESVNVYGTNIQLEWRHDSSMIVIATSKSYLIFHSVVVDDSCREVYEQRDPVTASLRRESAELFSCEAVPSLMFTGTFLVEVPGMVTCVACLRDELMVSTQAGRVQRLRWDGSVHGDFCVDLRRVPFCDDQLVMKAVPLDTPGIHIVDLEYSPLVGGFAIVLSDGRAAFLTASSLKFDPNAMQGIWARELDDANCSAINHKYRLLAYGRTNSQSVVYTVDELTGALEVSHRMVLSSRDISGSPGPVGCMKWTPDGTVLALCWRGGGVSLWSVFGSLLTVSLQWDYSEHPESRAITLLDMEWGAEGYEMWVVRSRCDLKRELQPWELSASAPTVKGTFEGCTPEHCHCATSVLQYSFVKSALSVNPCMSSLSRVLLQGNDRLYLSTCEGLTNSCESTPDVLSMYFDDDDDGPFDEPSTAMAKDAEFSIAGNKQWIVIPIPHSYTSSNWPIRYTCVSDDGELFGVAGRGGVVHYSLRLRKWHTFGCESQERDFVVTGGLLWWRSLYLVMGAYNIPANADEVRLYPRDQKLDNMFATVIPQSSQVLLINMYGDQLIVLTSDCHLTISHLNYQSGFTVSVTRIQEVDISGLTVHPACVLSVMLTSLRTESWRLHPSQPSQLVPPQSVLINISGRVLMIQRDQKPPDIDSGNGKLFQSAQITPIVLASSCESLWCSSVTVSHKPHLSHALWLHCGALGTRAWLPLFPNAADKSHTFMARRIMLPFSPSIYPLAVLFEEGILLGAETDTTLLVCDASSLHQPLINVERNSEVYLHHLLRQLLRRNLGYHAWEVANTCRELPYFPHALELLLHQVLEEEATSKDPLPDCLLPRVIDFIREFPVYLQTVVQCARKTELALWRYLFSAAGNPTQLFNETLESGQLATAASYLIIIQNLESASVSRNHATRLLDATLEAGKWELSKELIRFLRSIDPNDMESPKPSPQTTTVNTKVGFTNLTHATPPVSPACVDEDLSMILPNTQVLRGRSFSTASTPKLSLAESSSSALGHSSVLRTTSDSSKAIDVARQRDGQHQRLRSSGSFSRDVGTAEEFFLDVILHRHAKKLLMSSHLQDLGTMAAHIDFPLVSWLRKERNRASRVDDFVVALRQVHSEFSWPYPSIPSSSISRHAVSPIRLTSIEEKSSPTEDKMRRLSITVPEATGNEIRDSGYLSHATGDTHTTLTPQHDLPSPTTTSASLADLLPRQAFLVPHTPRNTDMMSTMSEEGSNFGEDTSSIFGGGDWSPDVNDPTRDLLSRPPDPPPQATPRPPPHAEVQLRYLLQVFLEAGCLEWSVLIAVTLRDAMAVLRVVTLARGPDVSPQVLYRLSSGLQQLVQFSQGECLGYQNFFSAIMGQIKVLERLSALRDTSPYSLAMSGISQSPFPLHLNMSSVQPSVDAVSGPPASRSSSVKSSPPLQPHHPGMGCKPRFVPPAPLSGLGTNKIDKTDGLRIGVPSSTAINPGSFHQSNSSGSSTQPPAAAIAKRQLQVEKIDQENESSMGCSVS